MQYANHTTQSVDEALRLQELSNYAIVYDEPEEELTRIVELTTSIMNMPIGGISLVDGQNIWLKARIGITASRLERAGAFCAYAVDSNEDFFEVIDAELDVRFAKNPLVCDETKIRYYAAAVLRSKSYSLGTLWVMSHTPHVMDYGHTLIIRGLASQIMRILDYRYHNVLSGFPNLTTFMTALQHTFNQNTITPFPVMNTVHHDDHQSTNIKPIKLIDQQVCAVGYLKIQELYRYNRLFGREKTDACIKLLTKALHEWVSEKNLLAHISPSKFAFAIFLQSKQDLDQQLSGLNHLLTQSYPIGNTQTNFAIRVGISMFPEDGKNVTSLLDQAESAAKSVSEINLSSIQLYQSRHDTEIYLSADLHHNLSTPSENRRIVPYYQPQVNFISGELIGFEALARWIHPELGLIPPNQFIHLAERNYLILNLDLLIFKEVCQDLRNWIDDKLKVVPVSSNFSRTTILHPNLVDEIKKFLVHYQIPPHLVEIEITETGLQGDPKFVEQQINQLRNLGLRIAIDDFGTGFSNLSLLRNFNFDQLKIDRQFVHDISTNHGVANLFLQIKNIAGAFEVEYICEGLENIQDLHYLKQAGASRAQGWLFARAIESELVPIILHRFDTNLSGTQELDQDSLILRNKFKL